MANCNVYGGMAINDFCRCGHMVAVHEADRSCTICKAVFSTADPIEELNLSIRRALAGKQLTRDTETHVKGIVDAWELENEKRYAVAGFSFLSSPTEIDVSLRIAAVPVVPADIKITVNRLPELRVPPDMTEGEWCR